jgi:hypothetical protein
VTGPHHHRLTPHDPMIPPRALRLNAWCLVMVNVGTGAVYLVVALSGNDLGASSPTLRLLQAIVPLWVWASALIIAGTLIATKNYWQGHTIAFAVWGYWSGCALASLLLGTTTGAGGVFIVLQLTAQHLIALTWRRQASRVAHGG